MDRLEYIINRLPSFYNTDNGSIIRAIINSISDELDIVDNQHNVIQSLIGINTTYNNELDSRWGKMLGISRNNNESDGSYRDRLKSSIIRLRGGTRDALQYAVAIILGIDDSASNINNQIKIYDAWTYTNYGIYTSTSYGIAVIEINIGNNSIVGLRNKLENIVSSVKACGVRIDLILNNYTIITYNDISEISYIDLFTSNYNNLGG